MTRHLPDNLVSLLAILLLLCALFSAVNPVHLHIYDHAHSSAPEATSKALYVHHKQPHQKHTQHLDGHSHFSATVDIDQEPRSLSQHLLPLFLLFLLVVTFPKLPLRGRTPVIENTPARYIARQSAPPPLRAPPIL